MKNDNAGWIDITVYIETGMVHWPGDIPVEVLKTSSIDKGEITNVTCLSMSAHTGTHIDAPRHFINDAADVTEIPLNVLIGEAKIFQIHDPNQITLNEIKELDIQKGDRVLFKTHNSDKAWTMKDFQKDYVFLSTDAAIFLKDKGVVCIGIDYLSIAGIENATEVHRLLLGSKICIIEGLNLNNVEAGTYDMICLPMKIKGADGAPSRVVIKKLDKHNKIL